MTPYWVTFKQGPAACVEAKSEEEAMRIGTEASGREAAKAMTLPYPAGPRLGIKSDCPSFCWTPYECVGRTCCPKNRACDD